MALTSLSRVYVEICEGNTNNLGMKDDQVICRILQILFFYKERSVPKSGGKERLRTNYLYAFFPFGTHDGG